MGDPTPTQEASREFAEAVFADPGLRERFETMAKETASRPPVPDDFAWLSQDPKSEEFSRIKPLTEKRINVPKAASNAKRAKRA